MGHCPNPECPARNYEQINYFVSQGAMDIRGLGSRLVAALRDLKLIDSYADIYDLTPEKLMLLPGIKEKSATNLMAAIETSKSRRQGRHPCAGNPIRGRPNRRDPCRVLSHDGSPAPRIS